MVVVVDYKAGNLYNVANALRHLGADFRFSASPEDLARAEKIILPGVGSARAAMDSLREQGLVEVLSQARVPFLGICLGLQLLFDSSEEDETECLGVIPGEIRRFSSRCVKVPHIGWNLVEWKAGTSPIARSFTANMNDSDFFYFVHSYYAPLAEPLTLGATQHDVRFASAVAFENFLGVQFHPERSGKTGLRLMENFLKL